MGLKRSAKNILSNFNPLRYMGTGTIVKNSHFIKDLCSDLFYVPSQVDQEKTTSFSQAMKAAGVTEADLKKRLRTSQMTVFGGLGILTALFIYAVFLCFTGQFFSSVVALLFSVLTLTYTWREHYYMTRLKYRRTHLTVSDWFNLLLKRK